MTGGWWISTTRNSPSPTCLREQLAEAIKLRAPKLARCRENPCGHGRGKADKGKGSATPEKWKALGSASGAAGIASHPGVPLAKAVLPRNLGGEVMIAGDDRDIGWRPALIEPLPDSPEFRGKGEVHEIPCQRDMIRRIRRKISEQRSHWLERMHAMPLAAPR